MHHGDIGRLLIVGGALLATAGLLARNNPATMAGAVTGTTGLILYVHDDLCHKSCRKGKPIILCTCPHPE
ncbi:MAG: hypothetical protein QW587_04695 [Candidatus Bathyarchaeia archaeon]